MPTSQLRNAERPANDDQTDIRDLIVLNLQHAGHQVLAVADGRAALASQAEQASDLLILDLMMPCDAR